VIACARTIAAVAVVVAGLAFAVPAAQASVPTAVADHFSDVAGLVERGGVPNGRLPVACGPSCATLWEAEHALIPGQATSEALHAELNALRTAGRVLPELGEATAACAVCGPIALGVGAFASGYAIGTGLRHIFVHDDHPTAPPAVDAAQSNARVTGEMFVKKGHAVYQWDSGDFTPAGYRMAPAPYDGYIATYNASGAQHNMFTCCDDGLHGEIEPHFYRWAQPGFTPQFIGPKVAGYATAWGSFFSAGNQYVWLFRRGSEVVDDDALPSGATDRGTWNWPTGSQGTNGESSSVTSDRLLGELNDHPGDYPTLIPWLDANFGGDSADPTGVVQYVNVPNCAGDLYATCAGEVTDLGLVPARTTLTPAEADLTKPADAVVTTSPASGARVRTTTTVTITANPGSDVMPFAIPAPQAHETFDAYRDRLASLGHTGTTVRTDLSDAALDPDRGPNEAVRTSPTEGTRTDQTTTVTVYTNPESAPAPAGGSGGPALHTIDLSPLSVAQACNNFPFGVPCWILSTMQAWVVTGVTAPTWHLPFPYTDGFDLNLDVMDPYAPMLRGLLLLICTIGLALRFYSFATGSSNGGGE
jgi:hypothetical protein